MMRILALLLALTIPASAHSWYPWDCCSDHDCHPVKCEDLVETKTGYEYDGVKFSKAQEKPSRDQTCHVCIMGEGARRHGMCIFTLQGT